MKVPCGRILVRTGPYQWQKPYSFITLSVPSLGMDVQFWKASHPHQKVRENISSFFFSHSSYNLFISNILPKFSIHLENTYVIYLESTAIFCLHSYSLNFLSKSKYINKHSFTFVTCAYWLLFIFLYLWRSGNTWKMDKHLL